MVLPEERSEEDRSRDGQSEAREPSGIAVEIAARRQGHDIVAEAVEDHEACVEQAQPVGPALSGEPEIEEDEGDAKKDPIRGRKSGGAESVKDKETAEDLLEDVGDVKAEQAQIGRDGAEAGGPDGLWFHL